MYTRFYNLSARPFQLSPDHRFYFDSRSHRKAMAYLTYGIHQGEGFIVITGDIGAGKTTLVEHLFSALDRQQIVAAKVVTTQLEDHDILRMVASAFGIPREGGDKSTLLRDIEAFLLEKNRAGKRVLLVVDEVQNLPMRSLEELRMLSNFQLREKAVLQSFLVGQPQFRRILADPDLEQLRQRVIASYHLEPLQAEETRSYIEHRLRMVGWENDPSVTEEAFQLVHESTGGVPRRINTLCSRLMLSAFLEETHEISGALVREVVADLEAENTSSETVWDGEVLSEGMEGPEGAEGERSLAVSELADRLDVLEQYVRAHERTIRRALDIAVRHFGDGALREELETG